MARRALGPAALQVVQAVQQVFAAPDDPTREIVVACSGGADSMSLACAVGHLAGKSADRTPSVRAAIVDHGLQPGSAQVAAAVAARLEGIGMPAQVRRVEVLTDSPDGMEAAARDARYQALREMAGPHAVVLLGHTLDDQAETVLLGLARGSGTRSLAGMPPRFGTAPQFRRPLLGLRRTTTAKACREWGIEVWDDPQNAQPEFARVRVRQRVMPMLEAELGPRFAEALARTAILARQDGDALDDCAEALIPASGEGLEVTMLVGLPEAVASRVLRGWLVRAGADQPGFAHVRSVQALVDRWHGQRGVDLPGGVRVRRKAGLLVADRPGE